ncbi:Gfo/Idh/MocA family oxidoreductase [Actinocorallia sp. B10E7]|uniref:Gfo/Idh/MocA family protein n=1 Tax=Actinocorallia sp. B10E7 TaxID=3153558 RepID=UPI00325C8F00
MRIGLVGLGDIAEKAYLPLVAGHARTELVGVASRSATAVDSVLSRYRIPFGTTDYRELLERDLDLVMVHAATEAHFELVGECLRRGVPTYVDKPLSADLAEAETLTGLSEDLGVLLAVGFNRRFAPAYRTARYWVSDSLQWFSLEKHRPSLQDAPARHTVYDDALHLLDLAIWLLGERFEEENLLLRTDHLGRMTTCAALLGGDGRSGSLAMHRRSGIDLERLEVHGDGRSAAVTDLERLELRRDGRVQLPPAASWESVAHRRGFAALLEHVLDSLVSPESCEVSASHALPAHRLAERLLSAG